MKYRLEMSPKAQKDMKKINKRHQKLISNWIDINIKNTENPRAKGKALVQDWIGHWRYRVGRYRIICKIEDSELVIVAVRIGHRKDIYKRS